MGFQYAKGGGEKMFRNERDEVIPVGPDEYLVDVFTRKAFEFLARQDERPFFLYLSYYPPHWPLEVPERYLEQYKNIEDIHRRTACAMISSVDDAVGEIMARLVESGLAENTMVVFLSDNGAPIYDSQGVTPIKVGQNASSNGPLSGFKGNLLEGGIRVPFLMSWPGRLAAGRTVSWPVSTLDLTPTFLAAAGAPSMEGADGVDLLPYLEPELSANGPERALFWRFHTQRCLQGAVRRGPWKWVSAGPEPGQGFHFPPGSLASEEKGLFNIADDPAEKTNLIAEHPEIAASLQKEFQEWNKTLIDPKWVTLHPVNSGN
jgi:arylsulfatase A-like enzyme